MVDRTKNRSDSYQPLFYEISCSFEMLAECSEARGVYGTLAGETYNEELLELHDQLKAAFWRIVEQGLTERQKEVVKLLAQGFTQVEIAKKLNVNQSSITKSWNGNCDYGKCEKDNKGKRIKDSKRVYGGAKKKITKIVEKDLEVQAILKRIAELQG